MCKLTKIVVRKAVKLPVPFDVDTGKLVTCHVELHPVIFLGGVQEMVEVFNTHIFNSKVIDNEADLDGLPFVAPETRVVAAL